MDDLPTDLNFLTVDEELALLGFYERKIVQIFRFWKLPSYATVCIEAVRSFLIIFGGIKRKLTVFESSLLLILGYSNCVYEAFLSGKHCYGLPPQGRHVRLN